MRDVETCISGADTYHLATVEEILTEARKGRMFILVDDKNRENEGNLVLPAGHSTPEAINFMATHARGLICLSLTEARVQALGLKPLPVRHGSTFDNAFMVSIEARDGITTGISAFDRAHTIRIASDPAFGANDIVTPGHVFPLRAVDGGVLVRAGHTEAAIDICRLAGLDEAAVICDILRDDGSMARLPDLIPFAGKHDLQIGSITDLIAWRQRHDGLMREIDRREVTSVWGGNWTLCIFEDSVFGAQHLALYIGNLTAPGPVTVRIHALNSLADMLGIGFDAQGGAVSVAMRRIAQEGRGVVVLLRETEIAMQMAVADGSRESRDYGLGAQILAALGLTDLTVLSRSEPPRMVELDAYGLRIVGTERLEG